jgi:hypothetical protein
MLFAGCRAHVEARGTDHLPMQSRSGPGLPTLVPKPGPGRSERRRWTHPQATEPTIGFAAEESSGAGRAGRSLGLAKAIVRRTRRSGRMQSSPASPANRGCERYPTNPGAVGARAKSNHEAGRPYSARRSSHIVTAPRKCVSWRAMPATDGSGLITISRVRCG